MKFAPDKVFNLKTKHNKHLLSIFQNSLGTTLKDSDANDLNFTGNMGEFIEKVNKIQKEYFKESRQDNRKETVVTEESILTPEKKKGKKSKKKKLNTEESEHSEYQQEIPIADMIHVELNSGGEIEGFRVRPEIAKIIMWREEGQDMSQIYQVIKTVNYLNRLLFKSEDFQLESRGRQLASKYVKPDFSDSSEAEVQGADEKEDPSYQKMMKALKEHVSKMIAKGD